MLLFILKIAKQLVTTGVQPDIIEPLDNEVREEHTTEQPEPTNPYSDSDITTVIPIVAMKMNMQNVK